MTERLDRIESGIESLNQAINTIVVDIVRPTALQTQANAKAIDRLTAQIDRVENISRLSDETSSENEQRFNTLLAESRAERIANAKKFDEQIQRIDAAFDELKAQRESMRALLSALATTNGRVDTLEQAS